MGTRYLVEYLGLGVERDFAIAFTSDANLTDVISVDRAVFIASTSDANFSCAGSMDRGCSIGFDASVALTVALSVVKRTSRRRRGILVFGCG